MNNKKVATDSAVGGRLNAYRRVSEGNQSLSRRAGSAATVLRTAVLLVLFYVPTILGADGSDEVIQSWLAKQTNVQTWAAEFTQTRTIKTLTQPLVSTGQVWFAAPQNFRWELGANQTIAVRNGNTMLVIYPRLKRVERFDFNEVKSGQWKDTLALLQTGFPRSKTDLHNQFTIAGLDRTNEVQVLSLEPKSAAARKNIPRIKIFIDTNDSALRGTELQFTDGSSMRNMFSNIKTNVTIEPQLFSTNTPPDYKVVEPLKSTK
jgi:outer membrane lipoprotein-sorting protein